MIDYDNGSSEMCMECDKCGKEETFECDSWQDGIDQAKSNGWWIRKEDEWYHFCNRQCYQEWVNSK
jgi:hypothetical protein